MKTWNLIKGRTAYVTNIKAIADTVKWSPEGTVWVVSINNLANIYEVKSAGIKQTIDFNRRINVALFLDVRVTFSMKYWIDFHANFIVTLGRYSAACW